MTGFEQDNADGAHASGGVILENDLPEKVARQALRVSAATRIYAQLHTWGMRVANATAWVYVGALIVRAFDTSTWWGVSSLLLLANGVALILGVWARMKEKRYHQLWPSVYHVFTERQRRFTHAWIHATTKDASTAECVIDDLEAHCPPGDIR